VACLKFSYLPKEKPGSFLMPKMNDWEQKAQIFQPATILYISYLSDAQSGILKFDLDVPLEAKPGWIAFGMKDQKPYCIQITTEETQ
jgi:hypothetical protein